MRGVAGAMVLAVTVALVARAPDVVAGPTAYDVGVLLGAPYPFAASPTPASPTPAPPTVAPAAAPPQATSAVPAAELAPFAAARDRWYVAGSLGLAIPRHADVSGGVDATLDFGNGATLAGAAGYAWRSGFRAEGQIWYQTVAVNDIQISNPGNVPGLTPGTGEPGGDARALLMTANLAYDFETGSRWSPYIIGGVGIANIIYDNVSLARVTMIDDNAWMMAFQVGTGVSYLFSAHWSAEASYRYVFTLDPNMADVTGSAIQTEFATHNLVFGARYAF